jgi:RNA polymerase sigma-70 factor (ECF subfamily)
MAEYQPNHAGPLVEAPPPDENTSDRSLLRRFQDGQMDAATLLYLRYARRVRALASAQLGRDLSARLDPDDLVQSIFRSFFRRAVEDHYDVPEGEELWKLLLVISLHKIRDAASYHRAAKRDVRATEAGVEFDHAIATGATDDESALTELHMVVEEILQQLPESQRAIIELRIESYQVDEIAAKTQRSRRSVERALQDFRKRLKVVLDEDA